MGNKETKLAFQVTTSATAYGDGGSVTASFLCATEEKARALEELLKSMAKDDYPDWGKE